MKKWIIGASALALLLVGVGVVLQNRKKTDTDHIDGGVRHYEDADAPKVIQSTEIACFHCEFSTTDILAEDSPIAGRILTLHAEGDSGYLRQVTQPEDCSFCTDSAFYEQLQQIVADYDFARFNGQHYTVSGLPPHIGMELEIRYASGEVIHASNNQSCFLPLEAMEALTALFEQYTLGGI